MRSQVASFVVIVLFTLTSTKSFAFDEDSFSSYRADNDYDNDGGLSYYENNEDAFREPTDREVYREETHQRRNVTRAEEYHPPHMPSQISAPGEKIIIVNPNTHAWGAYSDKGQLLHSGLATAGGRWCADIGRSCKTTAGSFRIKSLGNEDCISSLYPVGEGGAPMPYCMFFNGGQGLHGSNGVIAANVSHGCVRLHESDARWIRYHFATIGTKVIIKPY